MKNWNSICIPRQHGVLGIRKMAEFNDALLGRQAWCVVTQRESLLSQVFFAKYCKDAGSYRFECNSQSSSLARPICNKINRMMRQCSWRIGTGSNVHVGSLLWIAPDMAPPINTLVSHLTDGDENWIEERVRLYYCEDKVPLILNIPLSKTGVDDIIIWKESRQGCFNVKADYLNQLRYDDNTTLDWKKFWELPCTPKVLLFGWKCLINALPLGRDLLKKNFNIDSQCAFGCPITEDANHLFLSYSISQCARFGSTLGIHSGVTPDLGFVNWLVTLFDSIDESTFTKNDFVRILVFSWAIYMHRNEVRFQSIAASPVSTINLWNRIINREVWECKDLNYTMTLDRPNRTGDSSRRTHPFHEGILIGWKKDRCSQQNIIGVFHYFSNCAQLVFFYRENSTNPIPKVC